VRAARHASRARLVLLQGGRADSPLEPTAREEAAWRALSERIGWSEDVPTLPDDYEARLAEKIFGGAPLVEEGACRVGAGAVEPTWVDDGRAAAPPADRRWLARSLVVLAAAAAALAWVAARDQGPRAIEPLEAVPASTAAPSPEPEEPAVRDPGGTLLASAPAVDGHVESPRRRGPERTHAAKTAATGRARTKAHGASTGSPAGGTSDGPSSRPTSAGASTPKADPSLALALLDAGPMVLADEGPLAPPTSSVDALEPWVDLPTASSARRETSAGWSLAPSRDRWIGVSAASSGEVPASSGLGVVAQIDLASAIRF
jgi:hypothetical protein